MRRLDRRNGRRTLFHGKDATPAASAWLARSKACAAACDENAHALLPHLKTTGSARDMDSTRKALGAEQINYYGFSSGTYLAQVHRARHQHLVRLDRPARRRRRPRSTRAAVRRLWFAERERLRRDPGDDNLYAVYLSVECTDAPWPRNWNRWRRDNWRLHFRYPFVTWGNAWFNAPCASRGTGRTWSAPGWSRADGADLCRRSHTVCDLRH